MKKDYTIFEFVLIILFLGDWLVSLFMLGFEKLTELDMFFMLIFLVGAGFLIVMELILMEAGKN